MFTIDTYKWPAQEGRTPFEHQKTTTTFLLANKRAFVLNEMGTGKSMSVLWACDILFDAQKIRKVLIIGPLSSLKSVWAKEIFFNFPGRRIAIAHGTKAQRLTAISSTVHYVIINHDGIKTCTNELIKENFDIIVVDELTAYKSASADRTKTMMMIANRSKAVWGLTGEITPNAPTEAYSQCKIVNPTNPYLPRYYSQFRDATMFQVNEYVWLPKDNAAKIVALSAQPAIRFTRAECLDLPPTYEQSFEVEFSTEQRVYYDKMVKEAYIEHEQGEITAVNAAVKLNKLLQISAGSVKTSTGDIVHIDYAPRYKFLIDTFHQTPQKQMIVFGTFIATIIRLVADLNKDGLRAAAIYGDVNHKERASLIDKFQNHELDILVLQPQSSAHSITLVAASTAFWFSLIPSNELYNQGNARIVRAGQIRSTHIIKPISSRAEQHIADILERKGDFSKAVLDLFINHKF